MHLISVFCVLDRSLESVGRSRQESLSSVEEDDYDTLADIDSDKNIVRTKVLDLLKTHSCYCVCVCVCVCVFNVISALHRSSCASLISLVKTNASSARNT